MNEQPLDAATTAAGAFAGLSVLVTGGGSGIGLGCAEALVAAGATVTICGRTESRLAEAVDELGPASTYVVADVGEEDDVRRAIAAASAVTGRLDAVIANAGGTTAVGPPASMSPASRVSRSAYIGDPSSPHASPCRRNASPALMGRVSHRTNLAP